MTPPTRTAAVALSVEALLHQWARQSAAPAGAAVVADTEIAARRRGGIEWRTPDAVAVSVLARPEALDPSAVDVGWAAASLAAVRALNGPGRCSCLWPDEVVSESDDDLEVAVSSQCTLGPGRVEYAALTVRVGPVAFPGERARVTDALLSQLRELADALDDAPSILEAYRGRCDTLGRAVELRLLPHGIMRGLVEDIDDAGRLVLGSPTGLRERIAVSEVNNVTILAESP
jgi:BirA family biotin operon repressor/biotin-[acetyl-CoA-carboxylase] ligase